MKTYIHRIYYAWIGYGPYQVYVADIEDDFDEKAIMQQIDAEGFGWA